MVINELVTNLRDTTTAHGAPLVAIVEDFETRWAAWVARGHVHERRVRRRLVVSAAMIALGGAIACAFLA